MMSYPHKTVTKTLRTLALPMCTAPESVMPSMPDRYILRLVQDVLGVTTGVVLSD